MKTDDNFQLLNQLKAENRISPDQVVHLWPTLDPETQRAFAQSAPVLAEPHWGTDEAGGFTIDSGLLGVSPLGGES